MERSLARRRALELLGLMMIGDGVLALIRPARYARLWEGGPAPWRKSMAFFAEHAGVTRAVGLAEAVAGAWLGIRQQPA